MFDHFDGQTLRFDATKCRLPVAKLYLVATKYVLLLVGVGMVRTCKVVR